MLKEAVRTKVWASPVQPSLSSRCGQSVGTLRKLPRCPQTMFSCSLLTIGLEHSKDPEGGVAECTTQPVTAPSGGSPG